MSNKQIYKISDKNSLIREQLGLSIYVEKPDLSFKSVREYERTKHVHRLHPYLGKFIPQLVEYFLKRYFRPGQIILDPFMGSGTTLIEANILGMPSIGIDVSEFNCLIAKVKTEKYDIPLLEKEIKDILERTKQFATQLRTSQDIRRLKTESEYLNNWFAPLALQEILFYKSLIPNYRYQDVLKIILSRSARSTRLIPHYDLARPKKPVREPYYCHKHSQVCKPVEECLKFLIRYSYDTIERIKEFSKIRKNIKIEIFHSDSRDIKKLPKNIDGVFTSPPYVGLIDYHDQHRYAYELFGFKNNAQKEIGAAFLGQDEKAKEKYEEDITKSLTNICHYLKKMALIFIVANDKFNLYPEIARKSNLRMVEVFERPVLKRTERTNGIYYENVFLLRKDSS